MCEATTILAIGSTVLGAVQSYKQGEAQLEAADATAEVRQDQLDSKSQQEMSERQREARRERGKMLVSMAESGLQIGSTSFEDTLAAQSLQTATDLQTIRTNQRNNTLATQTQRDIAMSSVPDPITGVLTAASQSANIYANSVESGLIIPKGGLKPE